MMRARLDRDQLRFKKLDSIESLRITYLKPAKILTVVWGLKTTDRQTDRVTEQNEKKKNLFKKGFYLTLGQKAQLYYYPSKA